MNQQRSLQPSQNNTRSQKSIKSKSNSNQEELFDYLAYHGVKNQKAVELEAIKEKKELETCTF
jgi:hypothetical protein